MRFPVWSWHPGVTDAPSPDGDGGERPRHPRPAWVGCAWGVPRVPGVQQSGLRWRAQRRAAGSRAGAARGLRSRVRCPCWRPSRACVLHGHPSPSSPGTCECECVCVSTCLGCEHVSVNAYLEVCVHGCECVSGCDCGHMSGCEGVFLGVSA